MTVVACEMQSRVSITGILSEDVARVLFCKPVAIDVEILFLAFGYAWRRIVQGKAYCVQQGGLSRSCGAGDQEQVCARQRFLVKIDHCIFY